MNTGIEAVDIVFMEAEEKMDKAVSNLSSEYKLVRAGRANAHILDNCKCQYWNYPKQ